MRLIILGILIAFSGAPLAYAGTRNIEFAQPQGEFSNSGWGGIPTWIELDTKFVQASPVYSSD